MFPTINFRTFLPPQKEPPCLLTALPHSPSPALISSNLNSLPMDWPVLDISSLWNRESLVLCDWPLWLGRSVWGSSTLWPVSAPHFLTKYYSILWMDLFLWIYSSLNGRLGYFCFLTMYYKWHFHGHPCTGFSVDIRPMSLGYIPRSGLGGSHGSSAFGCFEEMADFAKGLSRSHPNPE